MYLEEFNNCTSSISQSFPTFLRFVTESQFPDLYALPVHVVESMLKALKMNSEEARLKFPRLLQIIESYPSETLDLITKEVSVLRPEIKTYTNAVYPTYTNILKYNCILIYSTSLFYNGLQLHQRCTEEPELQCSYNVCVL